MVALVAWQRRHIVRAATGLALGMTGLASWTVSGAPLRAMLDALRPDQNHLGAVVAILPGISVAVAGFTLMFLWVADPALEPSRRTYVLLSIHPVLVTLAALSDPWLHGLVVGLRPADSPQGPWIFGPLFWLHSAYCYVILAWSGMRMKSRTRHATQTQRHTALIITLSGLVPVTWCVFVTLVPGGQQYASWAGLSVLFMGVVCMFALFRRSMLQIVPVARGLVIQRLSDAVIVIGRRQEIVDINPAGGRLLRALDPDLPAYLSGLPAHRLFGSATTAQLLASRELHAVIEDVPVVFDVLVDVVRDSAGRRVAQVIVVRDITELHRQRLALAEANEQLQRQLATIDRLRADLSEQVTRDDLTGSYNRRYLMAELQHCLDQARDGAEDLSVLMVDLDHFKMINDSYGHGVGDQVLIQIAAQLGAGAPGHATVARYGGEEFTVLLPRTDGASATAVAENLRQLCGTVAVQTEQGVVSATVSIGLATLADVSEPGTETLMRAADEALYDAKSLGRNRVCVHGRSPIASHGEVHRGRGTGWWLAGPRRPM